MFAVFSNKKRQRSEASSKALSYSVMKGQSAFSPSVLPIGSPDVRRYPKQGKVAQRSK